MDVKSFFRINCGNATWFRPVIVLGVLPAFHVIVIMLN